MSTIKIEDSQPFYEGQEVVCINDSFPMVRTTNEDKSNIGQPAEFHPQKNEELIIDEILGPFLRFDKYDSDEFGFQWWHHSAFVSKALFRLRELTSQVADLVISDLTIPTHEA